LKEQYLFDLALKMMSLWNALFSRYFNNARQREGHGLVFTGEWKSVQKLPMRKRNFTLL